MEHTSTLILEGGALRGVYTTGVLDAMMVEGVYIPHVVGVSAGSLNGLSYVSRQPGRSKEINLNYVNDSRYMGPSHLLKSFSFFNFDFIFGQLSQELVPFDYETFAASDQTMWAMATDCRTGKALFYSSKQLEQEEFFTACRASASMPLLSSMVKVGGDVCLDGGIACCVPLPEELPFASGKKVVVLTRQKGFRKKGQGPAVDQLYRRRYKNHPQLMEACLSQAQDYNRRMNEIDRLEAAGEIFVIRPQTPVTVTRTERDVNKLRALYQQGYDEAMALMPKLKAFLGIVEEPSVPDTLDVSGCTNPLGMPRQAKEAAALALERCGAYPDPESSQLRAALAHQQEVLAKSILVGAGADDLIGRLVLALRPKRAVLLEPAYEGYARALEQAGCQVDRFALRPEENFALNVEALLPCLEGAQVLILSNPSNPAGTLLPRSQLMQLVQACAQREMLCVVDESFIQLAEEGSEHSLKQDAVYYPHLLVLDTFSKAYAMPGLRIGYCVSANGELLANMARCGQPFGVTAPAQAAALAALEAPDYLENAHALLKEQRPWLIQQLRELGLKVWDSQVNFVLAQGPEGFCETLAQNGLTVRDCSAMEGLDGSFCRLAVGDHTQNQALVAKLNAVLNGQGQE